MTQQCYYIGIDMDDRNAVISYYKAGMREPETLSTIAGSEIYQIPVALIKKRGIGQWFIGEEAKKMALIQNEDVIGHLLHLCKLHICNFFLGMHQFISCFI